MTRSQSSDPVFYVYEHWRPDTDTCFYVGKGQGPRAYIMRKRNVHHSRIQAKLAALGLRVEVRMLQVGLTETEAFAMEITAINAWLKKGYQLTNQTAGGCGVARPSAEVLAKRRIGGGWKHSDESKQKMSAAKKAMTDETRAKIRAANLGRKLTQAAIEKTRKANLGRPRSAETRAKISAAHKGKKMPPGSLDAAHATLRGKKQSAELVARRISACLAAKADKKARNLPGPKTS